ncbi:MAG: NHL repeat-containing protein, partial [Anaerolineae bacterium]
MKARLFTVFILVVGVGLLLTWIVTAQRLELRTPPHSGSLSVSHPMPTSTTPIIWEEEREDPCTNCQTILLWPKELSQFVSEYLSWEMWLGDRRAAPYSVRDELLVSVHAIATIIPDLEVETDEPDSDLIIVSGNWAAVSALLDQLRDYPLLERVTEDSPAQRDEARTAWTKSKLERNYDTSRGLPAPGVNIRTNWVSNVVWGYSTPGATICVTLTRSSSHVLTTTTTANPEGIYHAYLIWEIRDGDVIEVNDGTGIKTVSVIPLRVSGSASTALVTGLAPPVPEMIEKTSGTLPSLEVTVGKATQSVIADSRGTFAVDFSDKPFRPGTRGFLRYTDSGGNRIFMAFGASIVNVRRDTSYGRPYGDTHSAGISSIVWGSATPNAALIVTLTRPSTFVVTRTLTANQVGSFSVSVDRLIEDGDIVQVSDGASVRTVQVPIMTFHADPVTRIITGTAPAGIATTVPGAPHSFQISIGGNTRQVTTTATGEFSAGFTANPYLAGLLGALRYTTPDGDRVYKPLFVADPLVRGKLGDWRADVILGQPDFSQITYNEVVGNKIFNPGGVYVDRSAQPNQVYVYDGGNSRVLGLSHLGVCLAGANAGQVCTTRSDCPGSSCQIQEERAADIVFGQPSFNSSACNADSGYQIYPDVLMASAATLCGMREEQMSITEGGSQATMAADAQGNLYVPDYFNNRLLRYNSPFTTDTVADYVWGQSDFSGTTCNRGAGFYLHSDARSLCLASVPGTGPNVAGVAIDTTGNLWVADTMNNRGLRFPLDPALGMPTDEADLVLGQPDFSTITPGTGLNQLDKPTSVRVDSNGVVYVADSRNNRVLAFEPPLSSGMLASHQIGSGLIEPTGLEIDPTGGLWVNDSGNGRFIYFANGVMQKTVNSETRIWGGLGVDRDGNIMAAGHDSQQGLHYSAPTYTLDALFLRSESGGSFNQTSSRSAYGGLGLEVAAGQLIYGGGSRMLFWNNPWGLTNYQAADGVVGEPDFRTQKRWGPWFQRMRVDEQGRLWVIKGAVWPEVYANIYGYQLPLKTGATPVFTVTSPLPLQGGGVFTWTVGLLQGGIDVQSECDCLWLSDQYNHRVFRIRNVSTQPVVDVVLGQLNIAGTQCNQGRGRDFPSRDSLCDPGALAFDRAG